MRPKYLRLVVFVAALLACGPSHASTEEESGQVRLPLETYTSLVRRASDWRTLLDELESAPVEVDQWQAEKLAMVAEKARLSFCVPGVAAEDRQHLWGPTFETPQEAVEDLVAGLPAEASLVVIPEGPYVFSQVSQTPVAVA